MTSSHGWQPSPDWAAAFRPAAWILLATAVLKSHADPDLWGHVRFGLDILRDLALTSVDPYSFTQDVPWMNHEWLSEVAMGGAYAAGGSFGLFLLKAVLVVASLLLVAGSLGHTPDTVRWPALILAAWGVLPLTSTVRPQLWTLLLLAALIRVLTGSPRFLPLAPLIMLVWANVHGGWLVGLGVLFAWSAFRSLEPSDRRPSVTALTTVCAASLAATLINPYGWGLWEFLAATVRLSRENVGEWQPIWRDSTVTQIQWAAAVLFAGFLHRWWIRPHPASLAIVGLLAFASLRVNRLVPLFIVGTVMLLGRRVAPKADTSQVPIPLPRTLIDATAATMAIAIAIWSQAIPRCLSASGDWTPDAQAMRALRDSGARGRVITWFDWGEYAIWHLSPSLKVSMDGRRETIYSSRTLEEQFAIGTGQPAGFQALERLSPEYVWLPTARAGATAVWLENNGYRIDIESDRSFVAVRNDLPTVAVTSREELTCFPGR